MKLLEMTMNEWARFVMYAALETDIQPGLAIIGTTNFVHLANQGIIVFQNARQENGAQFAINRVMSHQIVFEIKIEGKVETQLYIITNESGF